MGLRIHDTAARSLVPFEARPDSPVAMYACGPTTYDHAHIGNFRSFLFFDLVHRYLEWRGHQVRFVMNLTDVDDKVISAARKAGDVIGEYTAPFEKTLAADARALGMRPPDATPKATAYVDGMVRLIECLFERGHAYEAEDGAVYFAVSTFPAYGKLRGLDETRLETGARIDHDAYDKAEARDFALWKPADEAAEATGAVWDSPWGRGRPGWHLECSAMSTTELGVPIDLHLGGEDLVFPHHENEIAQSEAALGQLFVRHWLHVRHLLVDGKKMSKSLGNYLTVRGLFEEGHDPASIRHLLISSHYRGELNFTRAGLEASGRAVQRILDFDSRLRTAEVDSNALPGSLSERAEEAVSSFRTAMDDDFNSAEALAALFVFIGFANSELDRRADRISQADREASLDSLASIDEVLGLVEVARASRRLSEEAVREIERLVSRRSRARAHRDYALADAIRDELSERGIALEDGSAGTSWKVVGERVREG